MSKEFSHDPKITKEPVLVGTSKVKASIPLNKNPEKKQPKITKTLNKTVKPKSKIIKAKETVKVTQSHNHQQYLNNITNDTVWKTKFFSLEKIVDFMKKKNHELMQELQDQVCRTIDIEEHKSHLSLKNKNFEDINSKLFEEKASLEEENHQLRNQSGVDKNKIKILTQEINHLKHEIDHLRASKQRLTNTIKDQELLIKNEKRTKQKLENSIVSLKHAVHSHVNKPSNTLKTSKVKDVKSLNDLF